MTTTIIPGTLPPPSAAARRTTGPILVAVGGSDATAALRAAGHLGLQPAGGMLAIAVLEPLHTDFAGTESFVIPPDYEMERCAALLAQVEGDVAHIIGTEAGWRVRAISGDPARAIADVAREERASLVVMATGRHRLIDRMFGETALRTIRRVHCPVLAIWPGLEHRPRTVVVATDFSAGSAWAAESVLPLLDDGATLHCVHAWQPIDISDSRTQRLDDAYRRELPARFARFTAALSEAAAGRPGITVRHETREGDPSTRLLEFADEHDADLIVAGRHGHGMLERLLIGSVTTRLLRRATCSLFVAPEPPFLAADRLRRIFTGMSESRTPDDWGAQLQAFSHRNAGRRTALESDLPALDAEVQETGFVFTGAAYDRHDHCVELMLGGSGSATAHLTRTLAGVHSISVQTWPHGADVGLRIDHGAGLTMLRFLPA